MISQAIAFSLFVVVSACSAQDEPRVQTVTVVPVPEKTIVDAAIASVRMLEDCPDSEIAVAMVDAKPGALVDSDRDDVDGSQVPPCEQATMQLMFTSRGGPAKVAIHEVRLWTEEGKALSVVRARAPQQWQENRYQPWDEMLRAKGELRSSYKLSPPPWTEVEKALGGSSFGPLYVIEADIDIDGKRVQLRSPSFARQQPEMIDT